MDLTTPSPVPLKVVQSYETGISPLIDKFYNKPIFTKRFNEEDFEEEFFEIYHRIRDRLKIFTDEEPDKETGIDFGPIGRSRKIGIVLDDKKLFRPEFLFAIWEIS